MAVPGVLEIHHVPAWMLVPDRQLTMACWPMRYHIARSTILLEREACTEEQ